MPKLKINIYLANIYPEAAIRIMFCKKTILKKLDKIYKKKTYTRVRF